MTDELYVLNEGSAVPVSSVVSGKPIMAVPSQYNYNASTNPRLVSVLQQANVDTEGGIISFVEIYDTDKTTLEIDTSTQFFPSTPGNTTKNLYETPGYRVTIDVETASPLIDLDSDDFFVLLNADVDEIYTHHLAKVTEFNQYDDTQYSFDFEPKYGEIIPKNTNVILFRGSSRSIASYNNLVAVSYGLRNNPLVTDDRHDQYVEVSRPTFYFYNNKDKLEPNKKYVAIKDCTPSTSAVAVSVFKTAPVSSGMVLDKSFYTQNGTITDARKTADETNGTVTSWTGNITNYDGRAGTNPISTYINFIDSPPRNNIISAPASINIQTTITNRGNYFEATYMDPERAMELKVMDDEAISIKQNIGSDEIGEAPSFLLPGIMNNHADSDKIAVTGLVDGQDLRDLLGSSATFEPIIIGSYYYLISAITAPVDGNQTITINNKRAITDSTFGGSTTVETLSDSRAYRKVWSGKVNNVGVTHVIDTSYDGANSYRNGTQVTEKEADVYGLEYYVGGDNYGITLKVARGDKLNGFTTLQTVPAGIFNTDTNLMECIRSGFSYLKPVMDASVEVKETDTTAGVFSFKIGGRDDIAKLLDSPVNRNYLYSQEYIYSTMSPVGTVEALDFQAVSIASDSIFLSATPSNMNVGDSIYVKDSNNKYYFIGVVRKTQGNSVYFFSNSYIQHTAAGAIISDGVTITNLTSYPRLYKTKPALLMGKSLSNYYGIEGATTMEGTANKGYVFNSGKLIGYGSDSFLLNDIKSSNKLNGFAINEIVGGYSRTGEENQYRDNPYGITNLDLHATDAAFHTISSMVDFDIIKPQSSFKFSSDQTIYSVGYVSPLVVGRVYGNNRNEDWLDLQTTTTGRLQDSFYLVNGQGLPDGGFIHLLDNRMDAAYIAEPSTTTKAPQTFRNLFSEDPSDSSTDKNQYGFMFGTPIWRYTNKHEGNIKQTLSILGNIRPQIYSIGTDGRSRHRNDYYESDATFNFSLSAYRTTADNIFANDNYSATLSSRKYKSTPIERSGTKPALGSRFFDVTRYPTFWGSADDSNLSLRINTNEVARAHAYYEAWDSRAGPLHLFLPGDVLPESKSRWNNLDYPQENRNITDYSIILKKESEPTNTLEHFSVTYPTDWEGIGRIGNKKDSDYVAKKITSSLGNRNRFNLVRMTEVVFDMMMNEVDYENYEVGNTGTDMTEAINEGQMISRHHLATEVDTFASISGSTLTLNSVASWYDATKDQFLYYQKANDRLYFIGEVSSNPTTNEVTVTFTYEADEYTSSLTAGDKIWLIEKDGTNIDVVTTNNKQHIPIANSGLRDIRNATAAFTHDTALSANGEIMKLLGQGPNGYMRRPMTKDSGSTVMHTDAFNFHRLTYDGQVGVDFYNYHDLDVIIMKAKRLPGEPNSDIQDFKLSEIVGATDRDSASPIDEVITVTPAAQVGTYTTFQLLDSRAVNKEDSAFLGNETSPLNKTRAVELLFRPRFDGFSEYTLTDDDTLTTDERIIYIDILHDYDGGIPGGAATNSWVNYCNNLAGYYIMNSTNGKLHYIKSHEIDKDTTSNFRHYLKIDNCTGGITLNEDYHLVKIAQDCFYDFSPNKITLNNPSSRYTKMPGRNKMHEGENFSVVDAEEGEPVKSSAGILSAYYLIEIDGNDSDFLITRDVTDLTFSNSFSLDTLHNMHITDGINSYQTGVLLESEGSTPYLKHLSFGKVNALKGTPSFGSIFTVTVDSPAEFIPTKASIGSSLNIVYEAEDIIDDILTNIGVDYNQSDVSNTYYVAQNFTGENVYAAANSVLRFKDKKLQVLGTDVNIVSDEETKNYRDIEFSEDSTDYKITMLKKDKSLFDSFNVVEVYGDGIKSVVKNYQKIKKTGREKVKEVFDYTISSQKDADLIARRLLKIYSEENFAIQINVGSDIPFMQPGQIVSVYFPSEGIFRSEYIVIEIEREFGQPTKLKLGEYNRELSNTMSLLLSETRNLQGRTKLGSYNSVRIPNINLQSLRVKFVKAEVTNLTDDTTSTIGFGYTIGFNSEVSP